MNIDQDLHNYMQDQGVFPVATVVDGMLPRGLTGPGRNIWGQNQYRHVIYMQDPDEFMSGGWTDLYQSYEGDAECVFTEVGQIVDRLASLEISATEIFFLNSFVAASGMEGNFSKLRQIVQEMYCGIANSFIVPRIERLHRWEFLPPDYTALQTLCYSYTGNIILKQSAMVHALQKTDLTQLLQYSVNDELLVNKYKQKLRSFLSSLRREAL